MDKAFHHLMRDRGEITVRYDAKTESIWSYTIPKVRPCYSLELVREYRQLQLDIVDYFKFYDMKPKTPVKYFVSASQVPEIYNYGGDLNLFVELIEQRNRGLLYVYAQTCIDIAFMNAVNLQLPITTISLLEGDALGGGFEAAMSHHIIIAEEQCEMGLPEIRFNLFPGMGAYSFLARSVGVRKAEDIIVSGKMYSAEELYNLGVITQVVKKGDGEKAVNSFMKKNNRAFNGMQALQDVRQRYSPIEYNELLDITKIWVDAALRLKSKDLKMMKKLVDAQNKKIINMKYKLRTKQDRRFDALELEFPFEDSEGNIINQERRDNIDPRILKDT